MATYKVIQDIEAEDKFLGPLTLKQFIFGAIGVFFGYLGFFAVSQGAVFLLAIFLPPTLIGFFLAIPWSSEQPTEIWVLAKLRFRFKNQIRVWDQAGLEELVTINVPKKIEKQLTNGLDQTEVQSRLKALADTIDSRGWAVKNATLNEGSISDYPQIGDRLINPMTLPQAVPDIDLNGYEDVLDEDTAVSNNFNQMIKSSSDQRRQQSLDKMQRIRQGEPLDVIVPPPINFTPPTNAYAPTGNESALDEQLLAADLRNKRSVSNLSKGNMRTLSVAPDPVTGSPVMTQPYQDDPDQVSKPLPNDQGQAQQQPYQDDQSTSKTDDGSATSPVVDQAQAEMTKPVDPDILELAQNNDLNISTLARQAKRNDESNEVVISLR